VPVWPLDHKRLLRLSNHDRQPKLKPRTSTVLAAVAAVALVVATAGATVCVSQNGEPTTEQTRVPAVEVQAVENAAATTE
jgi:hypothetical protein